MLSFQTHHAVRVSIAQAPHPVKYYFTILA